MRWKERCMKAGSNERREDERETQAYIMNGFSRQKYMTKINSV